MKITITSVAFFFLFAVTGCDSAGTAPVQTASVSSPSQKLFSINKDQPSTAATTRFTVNLSKRGQRMVTNPEGMDVRALLGLLSKEIRFDGKGNDVSATQIMFLVDANGALKGLAQGKPFNLKPGSGTAGKNFPVSKTLSLFEEAVPHTKFSLSSLLFADDYSSINPKDPSFIHPDDQSFLASIFGNAVLLKKNQVALVVAVAPESPSKNKVETLPMGLVLNPTR